MLDRLIDIAAEAGSVILDVYDREDMDVRMKDDGSPVTEADAAAEAVILAGLSRHFPEIPVVAEEEVSAGRTPPETRRFFLVDPLDGTREFVSRNGEFTVNIALIEAGRPVAGVVHAPALGLLWAGGPGGARRANVSRSGACEGWTPLAARAAPDAGLSVVVSRRNLTPETRAYLERFRVAHFLSVGSSLKLCQLAAGEADLYPRMSPTMAWDIAAGDAVLRAAGGMVRTLDGEPLTYERGRVPGADPFANPWFVASGAFDPARVELEEK